MRRLIDQLRARAAPLTRLARALDVRVTIIMLAGSLWLLLYKKYGGSGTFEVSLRPPELAGHRYLSLFGDLYWFSACFVVLGLAPYLTLRALGYPRAAAGVGVGDWRFGLRWTGYLLLLMLPVVVIASRTDAFVGYYPLNAQLRSDLATFARLGEPLEYLRWLLVYELFYALYFVGWEYYFRGFLAFGLYPRLGLHSILVANIPFAVLHAGKPLPEALGSVFAGLALGAFALRARSFWYPALLHALIAIGMDVLALERRLALLPS